MSKLTFSRVGFTRSETSSGRNYSSLFCPTTCSDFMTSSAARDVPHVRWRTYRVECTVGDVMVSDRPPVWLRPGSGSLEVVAIGASAGGLRAIRTLLSGLSKDFPGSLLVAHHRGSRANGAYLDLLQNLTPLRVREAVNGARLTPGAVYLPPAGRHIELRRDGRCTRVDPSESIRCGPR